MRISIRLALAAGLLGLIPAADAVAQGIIRPPPRPNVTPGAAPALPGLAARPPPAPIAAGEGAANLSPNAALFDAISRGDIATARDAVSRGADLGARNALGLTPLDAAVDQGRNEIAFFLLSAREMARVGGPPDPPPRGAARTPPRREPVPVAAPVSTGRAQPGLPRAARLWAGDGGSPQPDVGFLGFDAGRPSGAGPAARRAGRG